MRKFVRATAVSVLAALMLGACGPLESLSEGMARSQAVSAELEKSVGLKSFVGFNWSNGVLTTVTVTFQGTASNLPLAAIVESSKQAVVAEFKQTPQQIVVAFAIVP